MGFVAGPACMNMIIYTVKFIYFSIWPCRRGGERASYFPSLDHFPFTYFAALLEFTLPRVRHLLLDTTVEGHRVPCKYNEPYP